MPVNQVVGWASRRLCMVDYFLWVWEFLRATVVWKWEMWKSTKQLKTRRRLQERGKLFPTPLPHVIHCTPHLSAFWNFPTHWTYIIHPTPATSVVCSTPMFYSPCYQRRHLNTRWMNLAISLQNRDEVQAPGYPRCSILHNVWKMHLVF